MYQDAWMPAALGGIVAGVLPFVLRPLLRSAQMFDIPNERSSHSQPTLRAGGLAQLCGVVVACTISLIADVDGVGLIALIMTGGVAAGLVGLMDDASRGRGVNVVIRAALQLSLAAAAATVMGVLLGAPGWAAVLGAIFVAAYINVANFMDGINGISALHGLSVGLAQFVIGLIFGLSWLQTCGLTVAAVFIVFLPWNLIRPRMFLGDVGSYLLGALVGIGTVAAIFAGVPPVVAISPLAIYLADTLTALSRRAVRGEPVLRPHRSHAYQRLGATGLGHLATAILVSLSTAACVLVALLTVVIDLPTLVAVIGVGGVCAWYVLLPRLRGHLLPPSPRSPLEPPRPLTTVGPRPGFAPKRWAVIGASGFVGTGVVTHLQLRGIQVTQIPAPRLQLKPASSASDVVRVARQAPETEGLADELQGVDVVVNAAGLATPDAPDGPDLYGANALLPAVVCLASEGAGVSRVVHVSSAAVQGRRPVLDESPEVEPFSPYSRSKALGERAALAIALHATCDIVIVRATSVQGRGRRTTMNLRRIAQSPFASVAAPGTQPTVVSSLPALAEFIHSIGATPERVQQIALQPWEGLSVSDVLRLAGAKNPRVLPRAFCASTLFAVRLVGRVVPEIAGLARRIELMWFGQRQAAATRASSASVRQILQG